MFRLQLNVAILVIVHVHKDEAGDGVGSKVNDVFGSPSARPVHDQRASGYIQSEDIPVVIGIVLVGNDLDGELGSNDSVESNVALGNDDNTDPSTKLGVSTGRTRMWSFGTIMANSQVLLRALEVIYSPNRGAQSWPRLVARGSLSRLLPYREP